MVCPRCGLPLTDFERHVCEGPDRSKVFLLVCSAAGALLGGTADYTLAAAYGRHLLRLACSPPDATNLCGLTTAIGNSGYLVGGMVLGAACGAIAAGAAFGWRLARPKPD